MCFSWYVMFSSTKSLYGNFVNVPTWKAGLLNHAGRAMLAKTTLSAIPVHVAICCALSPWAISAIDKCRRGFIWAGTTSVAGGKCKIAWPVVCSPRDLVGSVRLISGCWALH